MTLRNAVPHPEWIFEHALSGTESPQAAPGFVRGVKAPTGWSRAGASCRPMFLPHPAARGIFKDVSNESERRRAKRASVRPVAEGTRAVTEGPARSPAQVSRTDLDRVIRRAAELQLQEAPDDGGSLSEDEVLRIGREVGLDVAHVRRALGEVRAEALVPALPPDGGPLRKLVGEGHVRVDRVVPGDAAEVEERLVRWFSEAESLDVVRRRAGVSIWEPAEGIIAHLQRGLKWQGQRYELAQSKQVELSVQGLEKGFSLVTLTLDARNLRSEHGGGYIGGLAATGAVFAAIGTASFLAPVAVAGVAVLGGIVGGLGGVGAGRHAYRSRQERLRLAAEGLLDRLERGALVLPPRRRA